MPTLDALLTDARPRWDELSGLVRRARGRPERLGGDGVLRLGGLYRAASADLALLRGRLPGDPLLGELETLVGQARHLVYEGPQRSRAGAFVAFFSRGYWRLVRQDGWALGLAVAMTVVPAVLGWLWAQADPGRAASFAPGVFDGVTQPRPHGADLGLPVSQAGALASSIFTHNITVAFLALAGGMTGGLLTGYLLLTNGLMLGVVGGLAEGTGNSSIFVQLIVPHGLLELSAITVASAAGFRLAAAFIVPGALSRTDALAGRAPDIVKLAVGTALWLVPAGLVEGLFTPAGFGVGASVAMGTGLFAVYWGLIVLRGGAGSTGPDRRPPPRRAGRREAG